MVKLSKLEQQKLDEMVKEFDWKFYVSYYDGLESLVKTETMAKNHFKNYGFKEGRICCQNQLIIVENPVTKIVISPITESVINPQNNSIIQIDTEKDTFIYYSKTNYKLLFQRPHQLMRFFDKTFNKIFIGIIDNIVYEEKYNLWIVPYEKRKDIYKMLQNKIVTTYFTDPRLYNEISVLTGKKMFDLIDAPIDEFAVWKPNLENCVKMADYVTYSHPELVTFLNEIDNKKTYHYISNACDYEYFSQAKNRIGERPIYFPKTDKPILGYYGAFAKWLDYDVIKKYADEGLYHIVMIGGISNSPTYNIKIQHPNITWLQHKPYEELAYYLSWFDVCFLPFKDCELTKYVNPCKLWEYMASEKEIIKTNVNIDCSKLIKYEDVCEKILYVLYEDIFKIYKIKQLVCSDCLSHFSVRFKNKFNLVDYFNKNVKTVYFGVYSINDINNIKLNTTTKFIIFGGTDVDLILGNNNLKKLFDSIDNKVLFHISDDIGDRLKNYGYTSVSFPLDLTDTTIFKKVNTNELGHNIFIYNGRVKGLEQNYGKEMYEEFVRRNPHFTYIYSNELNEPYDNMPNIYKKCFIGLRLTDKDGNANMVRELECMGIPVIHNQSNYGIKWKNVVDIEKIVDNYYVSEELIVEQNPIDFSNLYKLSDDTLNKINNNITNFTKYIHMYKNILFICGDYPGYGGASTNCLKLSNYFETKCHTVYSIYFNYEVGENTKQGHFSNYCIINSNQLKTTIKNIPLKPDLIILKSPMDINIKTIIDNCPIYYLIGGIYSNDLDKNYNLLDNKIEQDKYINKGVLQQIQNCDKSFCNSLHTQQILKQYYKLNTELFYSSFVQYYNKNIINNTDFEKRKYQYGLIVSNFNRKIKNVEESVNFLKDKQNVILIGKGSSNYQSYGFECVELVEEDKMIKYYKEIKYIVQDSFYESCSNVKVEGLFNGCMIRPVIVISSTQYPGYGGAATNAYQLIKYFRQHNFKVVGVFFNDILDVDYDPEGYGGIFLYHFTKYNADMIRRNVKSYLKADPNVCLAKNYRAPILCKEIFKCHTVYLVSGINHFSYYIGKSATEILSTDFIINVRIEEEIKCNNLCDKIVLNSKLCYDIFNKIYPIFKNKIYPSIIDTSSCVNIHNEFNNNLKTYDIVIACSRLDRVDKNNLFLIDVLKNPIFDKYRKIIIGDNFDKFINIPNTQCVGLCNQIKCIEYMSKSKVLLFSSLFDANSNTVREAIYYKCLPIITKNIGFYEAFPDFLICNSFDVDEWTTKLAFVLENYFSLKDSKFNFCKNENIIDSLLQI